MMSATLPNLFMPFGANDYQWTFNVNGTDYTMSFPTQSRWLTMDEFITFCNLPTTGLFATASPSACPVTISYTIDTNRLVLTTNNSGETIIMPPWNWNNTQGTSVSYNSNYRLGWTSAIPVSAVTVLSADGFPNIFNRANVFYVVTNISATSNNDNNIANVLGRIPCSIGWGGVINYENLHTDVKLPVFSENIKEIRIQLLDEDYQPVVQATNAYFSLTLGVEY